MRKLVPFGVVSRLSPGALPIIKSLLKDDIAVLNLGVVIGCVRLIAVSPKHISVVTLDSGEPTNAGRNVFGRLLKILARPSLFLIIRIKRLGSGLGCAAGITSEKSFDPGFS